MAWQQEPKPNNSWASGMGYLLTQALGFLLLENGGKIILDQSYNNKPSNIWGSDNKPTNLWANELK